MPIVICPAAASYDRARVNRFTDLLARVLLAVKGDCASCDQKRELFVLNSSAVQKDTGTFGDDRPIKK